MSTTETATTRANTPKNLAAKRADALRLGDRLLVRDAVDANTFRVMVVESVALVGDDVEVNDGSFCTSMGNTVVTA